MIVRTIVVCELLQIVKEGVSRLFETFMFVQAFKLGTFKRLLFHIVLYFFRLNYFSVNNRTMRYRDALFATHAIEIAKLNARCKPAFFKSLYHTMNMGNVSTFSHHTGSGAENFAVAEAPVFTIFTSGCIRIFSHTIGMKTSKALLFTFETTAEMTARQNFLATIVHPLNAVS